VAWCRDVEERRVDDGVPRFRGFEVGSWLPGFLAARQAKIDFNYHTCVPRAIKITGRLKLANYCVTSRVLWLSGCWDAGHGPLFTLDLVRVTVGS
jgi:hypothetical protein